MRQTIQWYFDIETSTDGIQFVDIRAGGEHIRQRLAGFFGMYRYFKLGSVHVKLVPAATLPVDPLQLSIQAGQNAVDPRDQLNPGMFRITNGESLQLDLTGMSIENQFKLYENLVNDPRWFNFMLQKGVSRTATPLYWNVGQFAQDVYPGTVNNYPAMSDSLGTALTTYSQHDVKLGVNTVSTVTSDFSDPRGLFQTGRAPLGWMPTTAFETGGFNVTETVKGMPQGFFTPIPDVNVMTLVLPPAHKTKYYYRCFVSETVFFKEMIQANAMLRDVFDITTYPAIDNFQRIALTPTHINLQTGEAQIDPNPNPNNDGGGNGGGVL